MVIWAGAEVVGVRMFRRLSYLFGSLQSKDLYVCKLRLLSFSPKESWSFGNPKAFDAAFAPLFKKVKYKQMHTNKQKQVKWLHN